MEQINKIQEQKIAETSSYRWPGKASLWKWHLLAPYAEIKRWEETSHVNTKEGRMQWCAPGKNHKEKPSSELLPTTAYLLSSTQRDLFLKK